MLRLLKQDGDVLLLQDGMDFLLQMDALPPVEIGGTTTLVDEKFKALRALGYVGTINDMEMQWLAANGGSTAVTRPEAWSEMVQSKGYGYPYDVQSGWRLVLQDQGYTGALPEMERDFWEAGGTFA